MELYSLHNFIINLHPNELSVILAIITGFVTIFTVVLGVIFAFSQIARQLEYKVIHDGWKDFQEKLLKFSEALSDYDTTILGLKYFIESQNNPLVNGGSVSKHRKKKWDELSNLYINLLKEYAEVLGSFENNEVIFLSLRKMKSIFQSEFRNRLGDVVHMDFMEKLFPEMYGTTSSLSEDKLIKLANDHWESITEISAFLDDFRVELQNETVGKIFHKKVPRRNPEGDYKILTKKGLVKKKHWKVKINKFIIKIIKKQF